MYAFLQPLAFQQLVQNQLAPIPLHLVLVAQRRSQLVGLSPDFTRTPHHFLDGFLQRSRILIMRVAAAVHGRTHFPDGLFQRVYDSRHLHRVLLRKFTGALSQYFTGSVLQLLLHEIQLFLETAVALFAFAHHLFAHQHQFFFQRLLVGSQPFVLAIQRLAPFLQRCQMVLHAFFAFLEILRLPFN